PALERFGHEVRVVHFIGVSKPWNWERTPGGHLLADSSTPERWRQLINLWWNIHDDCVSGWKFWRGPFSKSIAFGAGYHHVTEPPIPAPESVCQQAQYSGSNRDLISLVPTADTDGGHRHYHHKQEQHEHGQGQHVREVPDWDKDWSWADDRVHPLDYAYLKAHHVPTSQMHNPHQHSYEQQEQQQRHQQQQRHHQDHHDHHDHHNHHHRHHDDNANSGNNSSWAPDYREHHIEQKDYQEHSNNASQQDPGFGVSSNENNRHYDHSHSEHFHDQSHSSHHDNSHSHGGPQEVHQHAQAASEPTPPHPAWMQSQRPWEDVAREGWLHHDEYKPHTYDQSYIERRIADYSHNHHYDDNNGYTHHGYDHGGADQGHSDHHDGHGGDGSYHQPWAEHQHHEHGNSEHRGWNHPVWYGHSDQSQQYRPVPLPNDRPLYEASQVVLQPHDPGHGGYRDGNADPHGQYHHHSHGHDDGDNDGNQHFAQSSSARSSRSNTGSSPIYYPQPKSPMVVNPVALWESSEEQARRRAWAQHVRAPLGEHQRQADSAASIFGGPDGQIADQQVPPSSIDHIDSSQLPHETPWKISHVRQRLLNNDATSANAPSAARTGMQFKEGVANDGNARDAAGQLLQRWNEAVISRNIGPRFGEVSSDQISHSVPRLERGTDAIRLETTVSCEAEDSKGERTVYRFTLSSTLDVGGAQGTSPSAAAVSMQPSQAQQPQISSRVTQISKQPSHHFGDSGPGDDYNDENDDHSMVVDLRQPLNYQEPAMSRRSSFVQLPPAATSRSAQMAARGGSDNRDQFAVADARYWKLQRQLIDLEMSQRRLESSQRGGKEPMAGSPGRTASIGGWEAQGVDAAELASPPTPTRKPTSLGVEPQGSRRLVRRSSAFSIADPAMVLGSQELAEANSTRDVDTSALDSSQGRGGDRDRDKSTSRSRSSPRLAALAASEQAKARDFASKPEAGPSSGSGVPIAEAGAMLPSQPKRSRSHSALLRIATENRAQAVSSTLGAGVPTREQESTGQKPIAVLLGAPLQKADDSMTRADGEPGNSDEDSGAEDRDFKSAIGRKPTPFPRSLLSKKGKDSDLLDEVEESETGSQIMRVKEKHTVDMQSGGIGQRRAAPHSLTIDPAPSGFEPSHYDVSSVSSGTPMTPSRQKIRPLINWGDEDGNDTAPPDDDMSLSAQWLRIVNGAPPPRAPVAPAKAQLTKDGQQAALNAAAAKKASETAAADTRERVVAVAEEIDTGDSSTEKRDYSSAKDSAVLTTATAEDGEDTAGSAEAKAVSKEQLAEQSGDDQRKANPAAAATPTPAETKPAAAGTRAPPRKLHSTKSFLNLTSKVYDTVSDSEMDPSELELQERFWARAMRPPKSGTSTPYTPGRRKSVVEMSSAISPRDLEEWMQWQGEGMLAIGRRSDLDPDRAEEPENQDASHSAENMITPP
ncbi:glycogenin glucosyltransferase, partial [Coemansia sp. RSA 2598]